MLLSTTNFAHPQDDPIFITVRAVWKTATSIHAPHRYVLQHSVNNEPWYTYITTPDTTVNMYITLYDMHRIRLAVLDRWDRQTPFSRPSAEYRPSNIFPGAPGKPVIEVR